MAIESEFEVVLRERAKVQLRKRMRALRATIPDGARTERSQKIVERILQAEEFRGASGVGMFWPMLEKHEVDIRSLDTVCRELGKRVFYPSVDDQTERMTLRECSAASLSARGHGFAEPPLAAPEPAVFASLVVLVPALAVDGNGHRIGYGRGFYDRMLARMAPPARAIAVAYDFQLVAEVPVCEHDVPVAMVVTDARFLVVGGSTPSE